MMKYMHTSHRKLSEDQFEKIEEALKAAHNGRPVPVATNSWRTQVMASVREAGIETGRAVELKTVESAEIMDALIWRYAGSAVVAAAIMLIVALGLGLDPTSGLANMLLADPIGTALGEAFLW
ncbi:MAG: hypothetical protein HQK89_14235 [Nitrospirae bacterium]|nr:hypothetical protein [Nitrospirota bacterium]